MRFDDVRRRSRPGVIVAILALVAVVWLNAVPHRHADESSERSCPACQVTRGGGVETPAIASGVAVRPAIVSRLADLPLALADASRHGAPLSGRSPPAPLS